MHHSQANPAKRKNQDLKARLTILVEKYILWEYKLPTIHFAMKTAKCD